MIKWLIKLVDLKFLNLSIDTAKLSLKKCSFQLFSVILHYHFIGIRNCILLIVRGIYSCALMIMSRDVIMAYHGGLAAGNECGTCGGDNARSLKDNRFL